MARKRTTQRSMNAGTVVERPRKGSGTWHAYLPASVADGKRVRVPGVFRSEAEARRALNDFVTDLRNERRSVPVTAAPTTVTDAAAQYIEYRTTAPQGRWASATEQGYRAVLDNCVKHPRANLGALSLNRVTPPVIHQWYQDLQSAGVPASRIRYARWLLSGTFKWLITKGDYVGANPVGEVAAFWSKTDTDETTNTRTVLLPTWLELATMIETPKFEQDRVLIALLAWSGLRWAEATSLRCSDVWADRPMLTVARVVVWKQGHKATTGRSRNSGPTGASLRLKGAWIEEPVKGGQRATIPLPTPLWEALRRLVDQRSTQRPCPDPAGNLLFRGDRWQQAEDRIGLINNRNWTRDVWVPARTRACLTGDEERPELDPRRNPILIKDLRAFTASILHDAGATDLEASAMLRHRDTRTTEKYYARAMSEKAHDPDRARLRLHPELSLSARIEELWRIWAAKHPGAAECVADAFAPD